jgi:flagellar hook protein FlgE
LQRAAAEGGPARTDQVEGTKMSIYGALLSGVSALSAQSQALGIISDNISNTNTIGYKTSRSNFSTLVVPSQGSSSYAPGGVLARPQSLIDRQGLLQASSSPTDIAVSGNGFFVVNTSAQPTSTSGTYMFTRAGSFTSDLDGYLRNAAGFYLQGWPIDASGNIPSNRNDLAALDTINLKTLAGTAEPTTTLSLQANLLSSEPAEAYTAGDMAAGTVTPHFERSVQIFDSKGGSRTLTFGFFRDDSAPPNEWAAEAYIRPASDVTNANGLVASGNITFNTDGSFASTTLPATLNINTYAASLGIAPSAIALNFGTPGGTSGLTQFDADYDFRSTVNGAVFGSVSGVSVSEEGVVTALFTNGARKDIYKLPLAVFSNPNGLEAKTGNAWLETQVSGGFTLQEVGDGGSGLVAPGALESSTVDLANEFTNMIVTQRAYSAGTRVITTADDMLDELIRIKR